MVDTKTDFGTTCLSNELVARMTYQANNGGNEDSIFNCEVDGRDIALEPITIDFFLPYNKDSAENMISGDRHKLVEISHGDNTQFVDLGAPSSWTNIRQRQRTVHLIDNCGEVVSGIVTGVKAAEAVDHVVLIVQSRDSNGNVEYKKATRHINDKILATQINESEQTFLVDGHKFDITIEKVEGRFYYFYPSNLKIKRSEQQAYKKLVGLLNTAYNPEA